MRRVFLPILAVVATAFAVAQEAPAPERIDADVNARIRAEVARDSQVLSIVQQLTDVYGPRLTGSPNLENAGRWAVRTMEGWGLQNGRLEPWNWGHEGWLNEEAAASIVSPVQDNLVFEVVAWTPSTPGTVTAPAVHLVAPSGPPAGGGRGALLGPTEEELESYLSAMAEQVSGAIVLFGPARIPSFQEAEPNKRASEEALGRRFGNTPQNAGRRGGGRRGGRGAAQPQVQRLSAAQVAQRMHQFLMTHGAAVQVMDASSRHGLITAYHAGLAEGLPTASRYDSSKTLPTIELRNEDYGRIARLLADGLDVRLKVHVVNRVYPQARTAYNAIAEIPGTDHADEVVMLGGHLDSWHAATGATDNAIGCAVMMEAVRILRAIGAQPRRTIRVALWSGEEQGLLGSRAYVAEHFGTPDAPKPEYSKLSAYWNIDNGTGRVRGAVVYGPPDAERMLEALLEPFKDLGFYGAAATASRSTGGTDSTSFSEAGLPGINASQDPMEYATHTHHTNLDTFERLVPEDVRANTIITASLVYHLAMRDERVPRFPAGANESR
jgi:hypothetical protein